MTPIQKALAYCPEECTAMRAYLESLLEEESGWVSVEEKLPGKTGDYLTYETNHGMKVISIMRYDSYNYSWYEYGDSFHPTHWMPLPEHPTTTPN